MAVVINILSDDVKKYQDLLLPGLDNMPRYFLLNKKLLFNFKWPKEIWVVNSTIFNQMTKGLSRIDGEISILSDMVANKNIQGLKGLKSTQNKIWGAYLIEEDVILLNPEAIWDLSEQCHQFLKYSTIEEIYTKYVRIILLHELTHSTFDRNDNELNETRLSEGLANLIPYLLFDDFERILIDFKATRQRIDYNYFYPLLHWEKKFELIEFMRDKKYIEALNLFYSKLVPIIQGSRFDNCVFTGDFINPWVEFGIKDVSIFIGGRAQFLCNIQGQVLIHEINSIQGFLHPHALVITNKINEMPSYNSQFYNSTPTNIILVSKDEFDISQLPNNRSFSPNQITSVIDQIGKQKRKGEQIRVVL